MTLQHRSHWRSTLIVAIAAATGLFALRFVAGLDGGGAATLALWLIAVATLSLLLMAAGGFLCLWREQRIEAGQHDPLTAALLEEPRPSWLAALGLRFLLGPAPRPGDIIRVRSAAEISATLDADGTLDGLPFMPEMSGYCGQLFRVHRRIDKINDMRHKTGLRRVRRVVTLTGLRCTGTSHDGCQAGCQILWKDAWVERVASDRTEAPQSPAMNSLVPGVTRDSNGAYVCQMTRLWEASEPMSRWDWRQDLRPVLWGNVRLIPYTMLMLTRLFSLIQMARGGTRFPHMPPRSATQQTAQISEGTLGEGQRVSIRPRAEIAQTLIDSRTKGLWFDLDMQRFCGTPATVGSRVERLINEATGKMVTPKTPCFVLRGVVATGEFLRLCPQHEYILWRAAWLRADADGGASHPQPDKLGTEKT